jgi:predicted transcriptional regulator
MRGYAQASALPSAQVGGDVPTTKGVGDDPVGKGRKLIDQMVTGSSRGGRRRFIRDSRTRGRRSFRNISVQIRLGSE